MRKTFILFLAFLLTGIHLFSQVSVNSDGSPPGPSAGLDVKFSNKGILPPRMTGLEMYAIVNPAPGLMVFCTDCLNGTGVLCIFQNGSWNFVNVGCAIPTAPIAGDPDGAAFGSPYRRRSPGCAAAEAESPGACP